MSDGMLDRLRITPFEDSEGVQSALPAGEAFVAQFNPETFSIKHDVKLNTEQTAQGANGAEAKQVSVEPQEFNFEFLLDGTGASGEKLDVSEQIEKFKATTGFTGETHRNLFLVLQWGEFVINCVLKSFSINYKLFRPNGKPLRAIISATFLEHIPLELQEKQDNRSSPDLTHLHQSKAAEHLSYLCYRYYKDPAYYYQVAEANKLDTVRIVKAAQQLRFPPVKSSQATSPGTSS